MSPTLPIASRTRSQTTATPPAETGRPPQGQGPAVGAESRTRAASGHPALSGPDGAGPAKRPRTQAGGFDPAERQALQDAKRVVVLEYSSTGGGHTARSLDPLKKAIQDGTLGAGDCVVIAAPPRWQHDADGGKVRTLHAKAGELRALGVTVLIKQADKTTTGLYMANGDSDNVAMLKDFVYKPQRQAEATPSSLEPDAPAATAEAPAPTRPGVSVKTLLHAVVEASGDREKIAVVGDMAPALQKAASALGIEKSLEIGNHQGLFIGDGRADLGDKNLAYLHKASGSGHANKLALVEYTNDVNVVPDLAGVLQQLGIDEQSSVRDSRKAALDHLLQHGKRLPLNSREPVAGGGLLVGPGVKRPDDVKALVYLYVNEYTNGTVNHIRDKMQAEPETYGQSVFAVCGRGALENTEGPTNVLHVMYAAHADGVTNAGFGTTSEFDYMVNNGYAGDFVAFPVVNQHEQQANAAMLAGRAAAGRVTNATGDTAVLYGSLDAMVARRCTQENGPTAHLSTTTGSAAPLLTATHNEASGPDHAAALLGSLFEGDDVPMRANATASIAAMADYDLNEAPAKESRRIFKLLVPALDALAKGQAQCEIRPTAKVAATTLSVEQVAARLDAIGSPRDTRLRDDTAELMGVAFNHAASRQLAADMASQLREVMAQRSQAARAQAAGQLLQDLATNRIALGW
jgi:hypothetical protein